MFWKEQKNLHRLKDIYLKYPMVLYTGAGISYGDKTYGLPGWKALLLSVAKIATNEDILSRQHEFYRLWPDTWRCADWVMKQCGGDTYQEKRNQMENFLFEIIQKRHNYRIPHKQLSPEFLRIGTTLTSVAAFCCDLGEVLPKVKHLTYACYPNRRIQGVITTNYDPFLEAAATTMFRKKLLKPVAAYGAPAGTHQQIPVFHIHGYVSHPGQKDDRQLRSITPRLVITSEDYLSAWDENTAFGTTITPQVHYLRHFPTLFIGFSFDDEKVVGLLKNLHIERKYREESTVEHFAIMSTAEADKLDFFELGIKVIELPSFGDIPECLGEVYRAGLEQDFQNMLPKQLQEQLHMMSIDDYWPTLLSCRNAHPQTREVSRWVQRFKNTTSFC